MRLALLLALLACSTKKSEDKPAPVAALAPAEVQRAKDACKAILERAGWVETEAEVAAEVQSVDVTFEPDASKLGALQAFGLLARIVEAGPCHLEFFHATPGTDDVLYCIQKQIERRRRARKDSREPPRLWIVAAGRATTAMEELGFAADAAWPAGVYRCAPGFLVGLVVVSELPVVRETLLLRMFGAGRVLAAASAELGRLPADAPERSVVMPILLRFS